YCLLVIDPPCPRPTLVPYTTLFRSKVLVDRDEVAQAVARRGRFAVAVEHQQDDAGQRHQQHAEQQPEPRIAPGLLRPVRGEESEDRKSTRLNSSHVKISYAVFCLKK